MDVPIAQTVSVLARFKSVIIVLFLLCFILFSFLSFKNFKIINVNTRTIETKPPQPKPSTPKSIFNILPSIYCFKPTLPISHHLTVSRTCSFLPSGHSKALYLRYSFRRGARSSFLQPLNMRLIIYSCHLGRN